MIPYVLLPMVPVALRNLLSRPATRLYPLEKRAPFPGAKGHVVIDIDACVFCGLCARKCPALAMTVTKEEKRFALERLRCTSCGLCVEACNKHALRMEVEPQAVLLGRAKTTSGPGLGCDEQVQVRPPAPKAPVGTT